MTTPTPGNTPSPSDAAPGVAYLKTTWADVAVARQELSGSWRSGPQRSQLLNSSRDDWARSRRRRRQLVVGYLAIDFVQVTAVLLLPVSLWAGVALLALCLVLMVWSVGSLNAATRGVIDLKGRHVDERQRQERGTAYERAYRMVTVGMVVVGVALLLGDGQGWSDYARVALALLTFNLLIMTPTLVAAWSAPDEPVTPDVESD